MSTISDTYDDSDMDMDHPPEADRLTETAPDRVWLQIDLADPDRSEPYPSSHDGVSWWHESLGGAEVEYVRSDLVRDVMPENWREDSAWVRLAPLLGIAL